ncbi:hypothetical protein GJ629_02555 [Halapricum sp. CBA1109]|nr:hypothetical protein [Halapricum sp. CBA1109]
MTVDGPIENSTGLAGGFGDQHIQVYLRDPTDAGGSAAAREGVGADLTEPYQYRVVGDGENGARVETADGAFVAEGSVFASPSTHSVRLDVPKTAVPDDLAEKQLAVAMAGYDSEQPGNVAQVADDGPQVLDVLTPEGIGNADALGGDSPAIPYVTLGNPLSGELVERFEDATGDDHGPGSYTYPTGDDFEEGSLDVESVAVYDEGDRYRFDFAMAEPLRNPLDGDYGFSLQHCQVYVATPDGEGPTATAGREGTNAAFADPYDYRVVVSGFEGESVVEAGDGSVVSEDVRVAAYRGMNTITASVPKSAVGGTIGNGSIAPLVFGYDAEGPGAVRQVAAEADETTFGGGSDGTDPAVVDMVVPEGGDQSALLEDGDALPYLSLAGFSGDLIDSWDDPTGDDHGPGSYTYPGSEEIPDGAYDITRVELYATADDYRFVYYLNGAIENPWSSELGFSVHNLQVYIRDPAATDAPTATAAREGVRANFADPYHYRLMVNGFEIQALEAADGSVVSQEVDAEGHADLNAIAVEFPADAMAGDVRDAEIAPLILGHDSYGPGLTREIAAESAGWTFGGGRDDEMNHHVVDAITPEGVPQSEALAYTADERASIPFVPVAAEDGEGEGETGDGEGDDGDGSGDDDGDRNDEGTQTETTTDGGATTDDEGAETTAGDGPGFGTVTGVLGTAGGAAYAARRVLDDEDREETEE